MIDKIKELESCFDKEHRVILITGDMSSSKSTFINQFISNRNSIVFNSFNFDGHFVTDLANHFSTCVETDSENSFSESKYNSNRFQEFLSINKETNTELYDKIIEKNLIKNNLDYFKNKNIDFSQFENTFINKSDNKLVWEQGKIVVESFLVDLISLLYPQSFGDLSQNKPYEILFVFDDIDHILRYIDDNFISYLIEYLESKISKFENYDFTKDKDIKLSEVLDIRILICSRNKSFEKYQSKIELDSKFITQSEDNEFKEYFDYLSKSGEDPYVLAEELFFKYSSEFERNFLTIAIILKKFEVFSFDLFPELQIKPELIENYISNFYFISKINETYEVDNTIHNLISICLENTNPSLLKELKGRANLNDFIIKFLQKVNLEDFNHLRKLAYFNYFDINNAISGVFPQTNKKYIYLLDKYKQHLNKNNFHFSVKKEYINQLDAYNKIVDQNNYATTKGKVKSVWTETKKVLFERKAEITSSIDKTNKSIKDYIDELDKFNKELENINNLLFQEKRNQDEIKNILIPYTHKRPVIQTFSITLFAIFLLVISFLDIFKQSETDPNLFFTILEWIFRALSLLSILFVSKSLFRIFRRIKDKEFRKSQEDTLSSIDNKIKDQEEVKYVINADIKATQAKIQELETDISNYKSQLEEIELKLNEPFV